MPVFTFRIRLPKANSASIGIETSSVELSLGEALPALTIGSGSDDVPLSSAETFYVSSRDWPDATAAQEAADRYLPALMRTLARIRLAVDYGDRAPGGGGYTQWMIDKVWEEQGLRVINDAPGVMVFESDPPVVFASMHAAVQVGVTARQFTAMFDEALARDTRFSNEESVSLVLFNAAFFQESIDARFMLLMASLEALIRPANRRPEVRDHVDRLIELTESADSLDRDERESLANGLAGFKSESIRHAGRRFVVQRLGESRYDDRPAGQFFGHCYSLRSRLVHGGVPLPSRGEIANAAASLEVMLSDLLAGPLREVPLVAASG
jgi:hypothetical protein